LETSSLSPLLVKERGTKGVRLEEAAALPFGANPKDPVDGERLIRNKLF